MQLDPTPSRPAHEHTRIQHPSSPSQRFCTTIGDAFEPPARCLIGVLPGEGIGPDVTGAALRVLEAVADVTGLEVEVRYGGAIGRDAERKHGQALSDEVEAFIETVFDEGGAVFAGAAGGRFVYDTRRRFDLFCKISPIAPSPALRHAGRLKPAFLDNVDLLVVRENLGGLYQGTWSAENGHAGRRAARQTYTYAEADVRRVIEVAARLAAQRRGLLHTVGKTDGVPTISALWHDVAVDVASAHGIDLIELDADLAVYHLIQHARELDVVVAPNFVGDIVSDAGGLLLGSRGLCYGASFNASGGSVFQTNHGAAYDLAGRGRANPVGQILALAMLLRERFARHREAALIERAIERVWQSGYRTDDLDGDAGSTVRVGTRELTDRIVETVATTAPVS